MQVMYFIIIMTLKIINSLDCYLATGTCQIEYILSSCPVGKKAIDEGLANCNSTCTKTYMCRENCDYYNTNNIYDVETSQCLLQCLEPKKSFISFGINLCSFCQLSNSEFTSFKCDKCIPGFFLLDGKCLNDCPESFFRSDQICVQCNSSCTSCTTDANKCIGCKPGLFYMSNSCYNTCPIGTYEYLGKCAVCNSSCSSCETSANNCKGCSDPNLYLDTINSNCVLNCNPGTFPSGKQCLSCNNSCTSCRDINFCTGCFAGNYLDPIYGKCFKNCNPGTYLSGSSCLVCNANCATCEDFLTCKTCIPDKNFYRNMCYDQCPMNSLRSYYNGYYLCLECNSSCSQCSGDINRCIGCKDPSFYLDIANFNCLKNCNPGTFAKDHTCLTCDANCLTCSDLSTYCTSCSNGKVIYNYKCLDQCPEKTYQVISGTNMKSCDSCNAKCANCEGSPTTCITCPTNLILFEHNCIDKCPEKYVLINSHCIACNISCNNCINNPDYCESCSNSLFLDQRFGICLEHCNEGTFVKEGICQPCDSNCGTCINSAFECSSCTNDRLILNNACYDYCPEKTYQVISSTNVKRCEKCDANCVNCDGSPTNCISCPTNLILFNQTCIDKCPEKYLLINSHCIACNISCNNCINNPNYCESCSNSLFLDQRFGICLENCNEGTFLKEGICQPCDSNCRTCINSAFECLSCTNGRLIFNFACYDYCPEKTYQVISSTNVKRCEKCDAKCSNCDGSPTNCKTCPTNMILFEHNCIDKCPEKYVLINSDCIACNTSCHNCITTPNYCQSCANSLFLDQRFGICLENCNEGTFVKEGICQPCDSNCGTCINSALFCTSCSAGRLIFNNACYDYCPEKTYQVISSTNLKRCEKCDAKCVNCDGSPTNCKTCPTNLILFNQTCIDKCPEKYLLINSHCIACNISCNNCINNPNYCESCSDPEHFFDSKTGFCHTKNKCSQFQFYDFELNECISCFPSCLTCNGPKSNNCTSCPPERNFQNNTCKCKNNTYDDIKSCEACYYTCAECNGESYDNCDLCKPGRGIYQIEMPLYGTCPCGDDKIDLKDSICEPKSKFDVVIAVTISEDILIKTSVAGIAGLPFTSLLSFFFYFIEVQQELTLILFINIDLPLNMEEMLTVMKSFQLNHFLPYFFRKNSTVNNDYPDQIPPTKFQKANFSSSFLGNGLSVFLLIFGFPAFFYLILFILEKLKINLSLFKLQIDLILKIYLFFNFSLSLVFSGSLELALFIALQFNHVSFYNLFNGISFFLSIIAFFYLIGVSIFIFLISKSIEKKVKETKIYETNLIVPNNFQSIFEDVNLESGIYFPFFRIVKKILVSFVQVFFYEMYFTQAILRIIFSILFVIYFKIYEPFKWKIRNAVYEYTELGIALLYGLLLLYFKATHDNGNNTALVIGTICILLLIFLIFINGMLMFGSILFTIYQILKEKCMKKEVKTIENEESSTIRFNEEKNLSVELTKRPSILSEKQMVDEEVECKIDDELCVKKNYKQEPIYDNKEKLKYDTLKNEEKFSIVIPKEDNIMKISDAQDSNERIIFEKNDIVKKKIEISLSKSPKYFSKKIEGWELNMYKNDEVEIETGIENPTNEFTKKYFSKKYK